MEESEFKFSLIMQGLAVIKYTEYIIWNFL